ncbi:MAG: MATE family efflux transporter [Eubacteriales bacterium]|nr:MATE family efflux transporter [Eubacteriales bacterium]
MVQEEKLRTENKMGTDPVWSLLLTMALPVVLSTAVQSLYNVVDGIFVSQISETAMTAITFASPLVTILIAIGSGIAVGMNTILSHGLGEKNQTKVDHAASAAIWLVIVFGIISVIAASLVVEPYMNLQTTDSAIRAAGIHYLRVYFLMGIATMSQLVFERMLISTGKTTFSMISQGVGGLLNIVLDYVLIFGHFSFPALGIAGAAVATVISQMVAAIIALTLNIRKNDEIHLHLSLLPDIQTVIELCKLGLPTAIILSLNSFMMVNYNAVLNRFSSTAVAVFGVCCRVTGFCYAIINALCSAAIPVIAYNHGAKKKERIDQAIRYGYLYAGIMMIIGTVFCVGFPEMFLRMFHATDEMINIGIWGMRMLTCCYVLVAVRNMSNCILQALGHSVTAMAIDLSRNYVVLIPTAWILSLTGNLEAVWLSVPAADILSAIVGFLLMLRAYRKDISSIFCHKNTDLPIVRFLV